MKTVKLCILLKLFFINSTFEQSTEIPSEFTTQIEAVISRGRCRILDLSMSSLFEDSSPCRVNCKRANIKCRICRQQSGRSYKNCLNTHRQLLAKCGRCMRNPHGLTQVEIRRVKVLNNMNYDDDLVGETVTTIPKIKFTFHDIYGKTITDRDSLRNDHQEMKTEIPTFGKLAPRILFGWKAQPKQIPWHVTFISYGELQCGGTLVTPNKIVSAAHCFSKENFPTRTDTHKPILEYLLARAGIVNATRGEVGSQERKCSDIIMHS